MNDMTRPRRFDLVGIGECMVEFHSAEPLATSTRLERGSMVEYMPFTEVL